jgi:hypothetical protein
VGFRRAFLWGIALGTLAVAVVVVGVAVVLPSAASPMARLGDRVLLVVASAGGTDGSRVAEIVGVLDMTGDKVAVRLVDPWMRVTVPGTSYDRLRDAYPFGGGPAVATAYAHGTGTSPLPVVTVSEEGLRAVVSRLGGVAADVPADAEVFDGKQLHSFRAGVTTLDAEAVVALLQSADYVGGADGERVRSSIASGLATAMSAHAPALDDLVRAGTISSTLDAEDLATLGGRLRARANHVTVRLDVR